MEVPQSFAFLSHHQGTAWEAAGILLFVDASRKVNEEEGLFSV